MLCSVQLINHALFYSIDIALFYSKNNVLSCAIDIALSHFINNILFYLINCENNALLRSIYLINCSNNTFIQFLLFD